MNKENLIEIIFLAIIFGGLLYIGPGEASQHELEGTRPVQFGATDGFFYMALAKQVYDAGVLNYLPEYVTPGFNDVLSGHPPIMMHFAAAFSYLSGIDVYICLPLLMGFLAIFSAFIMYWLIRDYDKKVAILSAPLFVFLYCLNFLIGYMWGQALLHAGTFFIIALFFILNKQELKNWWILAGILIAASINAHTTETIFFYGFVIFILIIKSLLRKINKAELLQFLKILGLATLLAILLSVNYLLIFYNGYVTESAKSYIEFKPVSPEAFEAIRVPPLQDFHWPVLTAILVGIGAVILLIRKQQHTAILVSAYMLLVGLTNYIGMHYRAFQTRFFWPIYLALFFGLASYIAVHKVIKGKSLYFIISVILAAVIFNSYYQPVHSDIPYQGQWDGFKWLEQNTPADSHTLMFYGDGYSQDIRLLKRIKSSVEVSDYERFLKSLPNRTIIVTPYTENYMKYLHRKSFFEFGYYVPELSLNLGAQPADICQYDYYLIDRASAYAPQLVQANIQIANIFINHNMSISFQNDNVAILKNSNPGGECIG